MRNSASRGYREGSGFGRMQAWAIGLVFVCAAACAVSSCRERVTPRPSGDRAAEPVPGAGIAVSAELPADRGEIEDHFKRFLPDSGIVPVWVSVYNRDIRTLRMHGTNGLHIGGNFAGFRLVAGGDTLEPVHPLEVFRILMGSEGPVTYRRRRVSTMITGSILLPPLTAYFAYRELREGRYYRALFGKSLLPAFESGMLGTIALGQLAEAQGYLYFAVPPGANPYAADNSPGRPGSGASGGGAAAAAGADSADAATQPCTLIARACYSIVPRDTLPLLDCAFARIEGGMIEPVKTGTKPVPGRRIDRSIFEQQEMLFVVHRSAGGGNSAWLAVGSVRDVPEYFDTSFTGFARIRSASPEIVDVSLRGGRCACAVNFTSKSRIYLLDVTGEPVLLAEQSMQRRMERLFVTEDGVLACTADGFCHLLEGDNLRRTRYERLGRDVDDCFLYRGTLCVLERTGRLRLFSASRDDLFAPVGVCSLRAGTRRVIGGKGGVLRMLGLSAGAAGDTLIGFDTARMRETARFALPGRVAAAALRGLSVYLQLEDGTLLELSEHTEDHTFVVGAAAFLPFTVRALHAEGGRIAAVGTNGIVAKGTMDDYYPGSLDLFEVVAGVRWKGAR